VSGDRDVEGDESFTVALSNAADSVADNAVVEATFIAVQIFVIRWR